MCSGGTENVTFNEENKETTRLNVDKEKMQPFKCSVARECQAIKELLNPLILVF